MRKIQNDFLIYLFTLSGCVCVKETFDKKYNLTKLGYPQKIGFYKNIKSFEYDSLPTFEIKEKGEILKALSDIKNADSPETWKGAGWDRIVLTYNDTIIRLNTNGMKIGLSASGMFYGLDKYNFMTRQLIK